MVATDRGTIGRAGGCSLACIARAVAATKDRTVRGTRRYGFTRIAAAIPTRYLGRFTAGACTYGAHHAHRKYCRCCRNQVESLHMYLPEYADSPSGRELEMSHPNRWHR